LINSNINDITTNQVGISANAASINQLRDEFEGALASTAALSGLSTVSLLPGQSLVSAGVGSYSGTGAIAVGINSRPAGRDGRGRITYNLGISSDGDEAVFKAGIGFLIGK